MLCDTVHEVLICHTTYSYLVTEYANPLYLGHVVWSIVWEVLFTVCNTAVEQPQIPSHIDFRASLLLSFKDSSASGSTGSANGTCQ